MKKETFMEIMEVSAIQLANKVTKDELIFQFAYVWGEISMAEFMELISYEEAKELRKQIEKAYEEGLKK